MSEFPHLKFKERISGKARFHGGGDLSNRSKDNKKAREKHSDMLWSATNKVGDEWKEHISERGDLNLAPLEENVQPIFLQLDPKVVEEIDFDLERFGIEVISEEDDGFIIGASLDDLMSLKEKIQGFRKERRGSSLIAALWEIIEGEREAWKPKHILSDDLYEKWEELEDNIIYKVEVSIACSRPIGKRPDPTKKGGKERLKKYEKKKEEITELFWERQDHFQEFIRFYKGELLSSLIHLEDSFGCQVSINGKGLKDLVLNYPYVFEVSEIEEVGGLVDESGATSDYFLELLPPEKDAPEIGIVDSGIMQEHRFLKPAIISENSRSYLKNDDSVADKVAGGGHGTKVAGAALYPQGVSYLTNPHKLPFFVRNIRILDKDAKLENLYPAGLMEEIIKGNRDCRIFNLSVNARAPFRKKHMSSWAAMLDKMIHEENVLFIVSAGNLSRSDITTHLEAGRNYPSYLSLPNSKIANPGQSSFSIVVGAVNDIALDDEYWNSLGEKDEIAAYSRTGAGIWGHIKPDVVEYGGGMKISKSSRGHLKEIGIELIRSTLDGGPALNKESVGTSFSAAKVLHMAAELQKTYGDENINLIRALIVQSARLPGGNFRNPTKEAIEYYGYGIPSLSRVFGNSEYRVTFYNTGSISADEGELYVVNIPENMRNPGDEYDILIEVTLAYTSKTRRTRQRTKSYLATWLDWKSSGLEDDYTDFRNNMFKEINGVTLDKGPKGRKTIQWKIRERKNWGLKGIDRNQSSLQKDWAILKSYELPKELGFAIRGHRGWDLESESVPYAIAVSLEILGANIPIYESIRIENQVEVEV